MPIQFNRDLESIPFLSLAPQHASINQSVNEALKKGFEKNSYILGEEVKSFEAEYAQFTNVRHCVGVGNGYDAISIALRACDVKAGDEVIVPAHTYVATWLAVSKSGAIIVPVEPDASSMLIDVGRIEEKITAKTKVILPVHLYGCPCDMTKLEEIANRHSLTIIEDNAQAHGATWKGRKTGSFGKINATSFYPTKNLGALGDGGAVTTSSDEIATFARKYRNYGLERKNYCDIEGVNSRLDEMQAAVLRIKLRHLDQWNHQRRQLAGQYIGRLQNVGDIQLTRTPAEAVPVHHLFVIRTHHREKLKAYLESCHIETMVHYPLPPHLQKPYAYFKLQKGSLPITEEIADTCLSLPLWPGMSSGLVDRICDCISGFFSK